MDTHYPPFWREHLLAVIGARATWENLRFLSAWAKAEGGVAKWNPLNTTLQIPQSTPLTGNSAGVQNYPRPVWGVCATAMTITNGLYNTLLGHLQNGTFTAEQILHDCDANIRTWGTDPAHIKANL